MIASKKRRAESVNVQLETRAIEVPDRATSSLAAFRIWAGDNDLPEKTRVDFYRGKVWVDLSLGHVFTHALLKSQLAAAIGAWIEKAELGIFWSGGVLVTNCDAQWSGNPDGIFVRHESVAASRVLFPDDSQGGCHEIVGTPDMVLEVVSTSSVTKDNVDLREAYWEAGIPEYWIVDARGERLDFQILKHAAKGYTETRKVGGWLKSAVFGKSFKLTRGTDRGGNPTFKLDLK
jgi:Uma2 family endonuclease